MTEKLRGNRLFWYGHIMWMDQSKVVRRVLKIIVKGYRKKDRPKKRYDRLCEGYVQEGSERKYVG